MHQFVQDIPLHAGHRSYGALSEVERGLAQFRGRPMQLIWGMRDWCFTPQEFLEGFLRRFPEARVERLADAGHYVFEDAQEQVLSTSRQFCCRRTAWSEWQQCWITGPAARLRRYSHSRALRFRGDQRRV